MRACISSGRMFPLPSVATLVIVEVAAFRFATPSSDDDDAILPIVGRLGRKLLGSAGSDRRELPDLMSFLVKLGLTLLLEPREGLGFGGVRPVEILRPAMPVVFVCVFTGRMRSGVELLPSKSSP